MGSFTKVYVVVEKPTREDKHLGADDFQPKKAREDMVLASPAPVSA